MADPINLDAVFQAARGAQAPSAPTGQEQPDLTKELDRIIGGAGGQTPAPNQAVKDPLSDFVDSLPVQTPAPFTPTKGYGQAFMDAVHRGARQVQATPEHLKGIYASTQGDTEGQARAAEAAAEIQGRAPEAVTNLQDALESEGFERLNYWLVEKLGEQLPILAGSVATGGAGGVAGALVGRGLLSTTAARALAARGGMAAGAFAGGTALETAGTGEEQYQATGDYNAGVSLTAGVAKGALEFITPYKLISRVGRGAPLTAGGTLPGAILKTAATEGLTEGLQEEIDIAARKYSDPSYDYFGSEANWRRLESAAAGFAVGGVYGGAGEALGRRRDQKAGSQTTLTNEEAQNYVGTSPINWLYKFAEKEKKGGLDKDIGDTLKAADSPDVYGVNSLIGTIGKGYNLLSPVQQEELAAYKEDSIPRYAIQRPDGGFENKFYTRTEWERWRAENAPTGDLSGYKFMKVKPESLRPAAITALGTDLPPPNSGRIYFLPGTTSEEKAQLMKGYADLYSWSNPLSAMEAGKLPEARQAQYNQLLSGGLRVLPARGAGYHYTDTFDGDYVDEPTATDRSYAVGILDGNSLSHPWRNTEMGQPTGSMNPFNGRVVAVDFAKLKMGDWSYIPTNTTKAYAKEELAKRAHFADHITPERRDEMLEWAAAFNKGFVESTAEGKDAKYYFDKMREFLDEGMSFPYEMEVNTVEQPFQLQFSKHAHLKRALIPGVNIQRGAENFRDFLSRTKEGTGEWVDKTEGQEPSLFGVSQAKYASAKQLLAHFRIFSFRLMTEMKLPPVTIEVAWSPESGRSSQAEYSPSSSTIFVYLSKIHTFEPIDFEAAVLRTAIHELGHHITLHGWKQLPSGTKTRIWAEYNRYLLALRLKNPAVNLGSALMPMTETGMAPQKNVNANYFLSFPEYLAEQMTRLLTSPKVKAMTPIEEFYLKTQTQLSKLEERVTKYSAWKDYVYSNDPHYEFTKLYEHLVTTGRGERSSPTLRMNLQPRVFQNPAVEKISQVIQETFDEMKGMLPAEVQLEITQNSEKYGSYRSEPSTIAVSVHAVEAVNGIKGTLAHEGIHASWELFTESEKVILIEGAKGAQSLKANEVSTYRHYYNLQAKDLGLDNLEAHQYVQAKLDEEYVAALVQQRIGGKVVQGPLGELVDRIYQFIVRVVNKLKGLGYQNLDDILQAFYVGEMASRSELLADKNELIENKLAELMALLPPEAKANLPSTRLYRGEPAEFSAQTGLNYTYDLAEARAFAGPNGKVYYVDVPGDRMNQISRKQRAIRIPPDLQETRQLLTDTTPALRVGAERWSTFKPDAIVKLDEQNYVAREISHDVKGERVINFRYYGPPKDGAIGADVRSALEELGDEKGYVLISEKKDKGWEVDYITVNPQYLGQRYGDFMYKYIEESLETKMKPSGVLTADGYKNWKKRDPSWVRYHVWSTKDEMWYSPNFIKARKTTWLNIEKRGAAPADATAENVAKWKELYNKVPKKAWRDPQLEEMFHLSRKAFQHGVAESIIAGENQAQESEFLTAAQQAGLYDGEVSQKESGFHPGELNLEGSSDPKLVGPEFQPILEMIGKVGEDNPEVRKYLHGIVKAGDRNTGFSRLFLGLHQLTWNNAHIPKMREYLSQVEAWSAQKAKWISRADGVAKRWDKLRDNKQKEELAEFLFWLTEMNYRSPAEVKAKVRRQPTAPEFNREVAKRGLNAETLGVYMDIKASFDELLLQIEQIGVQNITQMFAKNPAGLQAQLADFQKEMASLRSRPYFPMVRFGQWTITARDSNRKVLGFYTYPTIRERDAAVRQVALAHPASDIQIGRMPEEVQEFMGLPAPVLRLIRAKLPGITQTQNDWLEQLENQLAPERSFKKRWLERKGTPGYSMDAMRAYSHYFLSASNYMSRLMYKDQMQKTIDSLRQESERTLASMDKRRKLIDYMQKHHNYIMEGGRDWAKVKSAIAIWYLGFSPMAAGMNLTQIPTMVLPYLSSRYGNRATLGAMSWASTALKGAVAGQLRNPPTPGYELARQELISQGKIDAGQAPELGAYANSSNLNRLSAGDAAQKAMRQTSMAAMWMFQQTERFNRELTFAMTYKLVQNNPNTKFLQDLSNTYIVEIADIQTRTGMSFNDALTVIAARESIDRTQFIYSPWARPPFMRGNMTGVVLAFFQYLQSAIYASWYNPGAVKIWLVMLFMYGLMGLPGAEDVDELVTAVARRMFGADFSLKREARKYVREVTRGTLFDKTGPDLFLHGISKFGFGVGLLPDSFGAPKFDASANGSLGKIIPGLAHGANLYGTYSEWDKILAKMTQDSAGAGFGYMFTMMKFLSASPRSAEQREWEAIMPRALKAASKAQRYWTTGKETNPAGAAIATFDKNDPQDRATMIAQFLGATPMKVSSKWEALSELSDIGEYYKGRRLDLYNQLDDALRSGDPKAMNDMLAAINKYNQELVKNDLGELAIKAQQAIGSLKNRARSRAMTEAGLPNQKALIPTYQRGQDLYPGVEFSVKVK